MESGKPPLYPNTKRPKFSRGIMFGPNKLRRVTLSNNNAKKIKNTFSNKNKKTKKNKNNKKKVQQLHRLEANSLFATNSTSLNIPKLHGIIERGLNPDETAMLTAVELDYILKIMG
jgi:hypothetical protein